MSCAAADSDVAVEPLRGWDGDLAKSAGGDEPGSSPASLPLADSAEPGATDPAGDELDEANELEVPTQPTPEAAEEPDGWLNPELVHKVTAPGSRLINFGRLAPYRIIPTPEGVDCPTLNPYIDAEQLATVAAVTIRGTPGVIPETAGTEGTMMQAHAVSYADAAQLPAIAAAYEGSFLDCPNDRASTTSVELELDGVDHVDHVDVLYVHQSTAIDFRIVVLHRSNLLVTVLAWVDDDDEQIFEAFVHDAVDRLMDARSEDEILPEDLG